MSNRTAACAAVLIGSLFSLLPGCDREAPPAAQPTATRQHTEGEKVDRAVDRAQAQIAEAGTKTKEAVAEAGEKISPKVQEAGAAVAEAGSKVAAVVRDAVKVERTEGAPMRVTGPSITVQTGPKTSISGVPPETRTAVNDATITASIKAQLIKEPDLSALKIDVDTRDGVVTLNGLAGNESARERAAQLAAATKGVREVRNNLTVKQG